LVEKPRRETFEFFSNAHNLELITPPHLRFRVLTPAPIHMCEGARIDYRLALYGVPIRWTTLIEIWKPDEVFVDSQASGPYLFWRHTHTFEESSANATLVGDRVEYAMPYGVAGLLAHKLFVKSKLDEIFDYRARVIDRLLSREKSQLTPAGGIEGLTGC
jgi:ligand-binding SRPBCC domain-containing protein